MNWGTTLSSADAGAALTRLPGGTSVSRTPRMSRLPALALSSGLAIALSACGGGNDRAATGPAPGAAGSTSAPATSAPATSAPATSAPAGGISATHNGADVDFINGMNPHHTGAVEMARLAEQRAASAEVKRLAREIAEAQAPEQQRMAAMAAAWGVPAPAATESGHGGGHGVGHGGMADDVAALRGLSGAAFDREFLRRMIEHHRSALPMARTELAKGSNPEAKRLAQEIVEVQTREIAEMERLLRA